jgi:C4-dicarboxylate transporter DctM subunit
MADFFIVVLILVGLAVLRIPLYLTILSATLFLQIFVNHISLAGTINSTIESVAKSSLLCIPFFILVGNLMQNGSLGRRLTDLFMVLLRRVQFGLSVAALLSNAFFGAISGSAPAAVATFSKIIYKPLAEQYDEKLAIGLITSSGTLSTVIPPSITLVIYGAATNTSTARLFMAGFLPGVMIVLIVTGYLVVRCKNSFRYRSEAPDKPLDSRGGSEVFSAVDINAKTALLRALPVLLLPVLILGGIYCGAFTPTEAAAIAIVYTCVASLLLRDLRINDLPRVLMDSAKTAAQIMIMISMSSAFAQAAIVAQLPQTVTTLFISLSPLQFIFLLNILLLFVGCFFEPGAAILILGPLILPTASALGIDPIHLGIIFTVNLSIGMFTPPFGLNIFVVQGVLGKKMGLIAKSAVPYMILYFISTLLVSYIPPISLFLPGLLM